MSDRGLLARALLELTLDGETPMVVVDTRHPGVRVPEGYAKDGKLTLNIGTSAVSNDVSTEDWFEFDVRFSGEIRHVRFPISAVLAIGGRESRRGITLRDSRIQ
jgi:stringent starvation protein B